MHPQEILRWNKQQIETVLQRTTGLQNEAWLPSIQTAIQAMEQGWRARLFPRSATRQVLAKAMQFRQSESNASARWYIACLVESLAIIRLLSLKSGSNVWVSDYQSAKNLVFEHFTRPSSRSGSRALHSAAEDLVVAMEKEAKLKAEKQQRLLNVLLAGSSAGNALPPKAAPAPVRPSPPAPSGRQSIRLLYRVVPHNGGAVFAFEDRAQLIADIHQAIATARTWSEFAQLMPANEYQKIIDQFDEEDEPPPARDRSFSGDQIRGYSDGDYPPWLQAEMDTVIPTDILKRFGRPQSTMINGRYWHIPETQMEPMANALRELGFDLVKAQKIPFH